MRRWLATLEVEYWYWLERRRLPDAIGAWCLRNRYRAERYRHPDLFRRVTWG